VLPSKEEFERLVKQLSRYNMDMTALSGRSGFTYDIDGIKIQVQHE
jgi:hypothetical protein